MKDIYGKLVDYGERFMSMFDDHDERKSSGKSATTTKRKNTPDYTKRQPSEENLDGQMHINTPRGEIYEYKDMNIQKRKPRDELDDIFSSIKEEECEPPEYQQTPVEQQRSTSNTVLSRQKQKRHKSSQPTNTVYEDEKDLRNIKAERKRFMSSNVDKILAAEYKDQDAVRRKKSSNLHDEESYHDKEEFLKIRREIQAFGATGLDKRSRNSFEQNRLAELGARRQKGPRIPASVGLGMAKKAAQREERALEEAIAAGMVSRKSLASKKRREKKSSMSRGLNEDRGSFKNGVLRVRQALGRKSGGTRRG